MPKPLQQEPAQADPAGGAAPSTAHEGGAGPGMSVLQDDGAGGRAVGRPRDQRVDDKVARAAVVQFGETGFAGFTIEGVARRAGVGKAAIYRRWSDKEQLLADAWDRRLPRIEDVDTGNLRGDLVELATQMIELYSGESGPAAARLLSEAGQAGVLASTVDRQRQSQIRAARAIVRRAIARAELPPETPVTILLDCLVGGAMLHVLSTPTDRRAELNLRAAEVGAQLVAFLLPERFG